MSDFLDLVPDPKHRTRFERLLRLAAQRGDDDLVAERLSWGIDPNGAGPDGRTALIENVRGPSANVATVRTLLDAGAEPSLMDHAGVTALDHARRTLVRIQSLPYEPIRKSPSLDENNQLQLGPDEQAELDKLRREIGPEDAREFGRVYWKERLRAARRTFDDESQVERIVEMLDDAKAD